MNPPARKFALLFGLLLFGAACGGGGDPEPAAATPTQTPEAQTAGPAAALRRHVMETMAKDYAGDCASTEAGRDAGKICSVERAQRANQRAYVLGLVASEGAQWVILEERGGQWPVVQTQAITGDNRAVPGIPWPLRLGVDVVVAGADPCVNVRTEPKIVAGNAVDCIRDGTVIKLSAGPTLADDIQWWQVVGRSGWVAGDYLRYTDAAQ